MEAASLTDPVGISSVRRYHLGELRWSKWWWGTTSHLIRCFHPQQPATCMSVELNNWSQIQAPAAPDPAQESTWAGECCLEGNIKFPKTVFHTEGSYGKSKGRVLIEVLALCRWFCLHRILCWFRLRRLAQSLRRGNRNFEGIVLPGVRACFRTWTGARNPSHVEVRNVGLRGRRRESGQAQCFVDVAKPLAGVCHSRDCVLRGRRREFAPWILCFEVEGLNSWEALHFWNLSLRMILRGQCSFLYDIWPRLMISWQVQYFWSMVSKDELFAEIVGVECAECW